MGEYSLENYSPYETYKIRPRPMLNIVDQIGRGRIHYLNYTWEELERERGQYQLEELHQAVKTTINPMLVITPEPPKWLRNGSRECFGSLIRRIGSELKGEKLIVGVFITSLNSTPQVWDAYLEAFERVPLLVHLQDKELINYLKEKQVNFGVAVSCEEDNWIESCEDFAKQRVQNNWEKAPVLLQSKEDKIGNNVLREIRRWHVSFADVPMDVGYKYVLRRVTYPKRISSNGALPIRYWLVNEGSAPCYFDFGLKIMLQKENTQYIIDLKIDRAAWQKGDITHNEIVKLPVMEPGIYKVSTGLFLDEGIPIRLCIEGEEEQGFYELGKIEVDSQDRKELFHIWDHFYPEGYYPLEDPKEPS